MATNLLENASDPGSPLRPWSILPKINLAPDVPLLSGSDGIVYFKTVEMIRLLLKMDVPLFLLYCG